MTFTVTRDQLESKRVELAKEGVPLTGDSGILTDHGVSIDFHYNEPTLTVEITNYGGHPQFIVNHVVSNWFKEK